MPISSPNRMFDPLLESSHQDDSNKWSIIGFSEEIIKVVLIEVNFIQSTLDISNSFISNSVKFEASL